MRNAVHLITYADRLGGTLAGLDALLRGPLAGVFAGVHILPFYTPIDRADAGFDPIDHTEVDQRLGSWDDVATLAEHSDVMADVIVNHISSESPQFRDFLAHGDASAHAGMFLTFGGVFAEGATEADLLRIYRPRPGLPFTTYTLSDRTRRVMWTTFTSEQIDVDVHSPETQAYLESILDRLAEHGVGVVRLDAVGYAVKTAGTACFMTPETFTFIDTLKALAMQRGIETLVEIHSHYEQQIAIADRVDWVYDFCLGPLALHSVFSGSTTALRRWLSVRPRNSVTVLDTHDGIGVRDVGPDVNNPAAAGLLGPDEIDALVERIHANTRGDSRLATGSAAANVDLYQVNTTYYDALGRDNDAYLLTRLLQLFVPGVPQVYYVGLLAGTNDLDLLERTGVGRDINRHRYVPAEVEEALATPVVQDLLALIRLRNTHPAFAGTWSLEDGDATGLAMRWEAADAGAHLSVDMAARTFRLTLRDGARDHTVTSAAELP
jgi:sucrose phosphorylase